MPRRLIPCLALLLSAPVAHAQVDPPSMEDEDANAPRKEPDVPADSAPVDAPADSAPADSATDDTGSASGDGGVHDQELGVRVGLVSGGRVTPGGLRVGAQYLYQVDDDVWFDGGLLFTFGGGNAECFRDRSDDLVCDHGRLSGTAGEIALAIRYFLPRQAYGFLPYARGGAAVRVVRFGDDDVTGLAIPLFAGAGLRVRVAPNVAVGVEGQLELGAGIFSRGLGLEPQLALAIGGLVEIALP
jgi:hypothetical protein